MRLHEDDLDPLSEFDSSKCRHKVMQQIVVVICGLKFDCFAWAPKKHFFCGLHQRLLFCKMCFRVFLAGRSFSVAAFALYRVPTCVWCSLYRNPIITTKNIDLVFLPSCLLLYLIVCFVYLICRYFPPTYSRIECGEARTDGLFVERWLLYNAG